MRSRQTFETSFQEARRFFGLSGAPQGSPTVASWALIAALFLASAAFLALSPADGVGTYLGAALWLIAAVMAIRGWIRLQRLRRGKST